MNKVAMSKEPIMKLSRRDLLGFGGGIAAGLVFTPVPWKVLDATAKWTQNWPWIPQPSRGPVDVKYAPCALCAQGCGLKIRMAGGWAVGLAGMPEHPVSRGALCPLAFGAHQLNWHPRRVRGVLHHGRPSSWEEAKAAFTKASAEGTVGIVDGRPGRAASLVLETFAKAQGGRYLTALTAEERALAPYGTWSGVPVSALGYDLENAQTILSFGAPLLDGWGTPGRFTRLWAERAAGLDDPPLRVIQVESLLSRTAASAWRRATIHPRSEAALAGGLARVLIEERLVAARGPMPPIPISEAVAQTGLTAQAIQDLARILVARGPVVAIAADDEPAIAALNLVLGAVGRRGGIVRRAERTPAALDVRAVTEPLRAVLLDSTAPWDLPVRPGAEVFRFAAWAGGGPAADWLLPAPGFLEDLAEAPTAPTSSFETYAVAPQLVERPKGVIGAAEFLTKIDPSAGTVADAIRARCEELFHARKGKLHVPGKEQPTPLTDIGTAAKLQEGLLAGAVWAADPLRNPGFHCELREWPQVSAEPLRPAAWTDAWTVPVLPPLAAKLFQESRLRPGPGRSEI
jgi:hypothetical protein